MKLKIDIKLKRKNRYLKTYFWICGLLMLLRGCWL